MYFFLIRKKDFFTVCIRTVCLKVFLLLGSCMFLYTGFFFKVFKTLNFKPDILMSVWHQLSKEVTKHTQYGFFNF